LNGAVSAAIAGQTDRVAPPPVGTKGPAIAPNADPRAQAEQPKVVEEGSRPAGEGDEDAPFWPDESAEVAFLSETQDRGTTTPAALVAPGETEEETDRRAAVPALEDLVVRIPAEVREVLEELFRAKFVAVKRIPKRELKR